MVSGFNRLLTPWLYAGPFLLLRPATAFPQFPELKIVFVRGTYDGLVGNRLNYKKANSNPLARSSVVFPSYSCRCVIGVTGFHWLFSFFQVSA